MSRRVLVCGGRGYRDDRTVAATLDALHAEERIAVLLHGGASGADTIADTWAWRKRRTQEGPIVQRYAVSDADWGAHGRAAGPMRNQRMLDEGKPDLVVAFAGGRGTADMVRRARRAGVPVVEVA